MNMGIIGGLPGEDRPQHRDRWSQPLGRAYPCLAHDRRCAGHVDLEHLGRQISVGAPFGQLDRKRNLFGRRELRLGFKLSRPEGYQRR